MSSAESLYNSVGESAGFEFQHRITTHTTIGILALHEDTTYRGGLAFGNTLRSQIESEYVSFGSRLTPTLSIVAFGGLQYVRTVGAVTAASTVSGNFQGSGGFSLTRQGHVTAYELSFQRAVTDSGGLYTSVVDTNVMFGVRRRLYGHWDGNLRGSLARSDTSLFQFVNGTTDAVLASIEFTHPIRERTVIHVSYDTTHQVSSGILPIFSDFDRNQVTIGFDFLVKDISLKQ